MFLLLHHKISRHVNRYLLHLVEMTFLVRLIAAAWGKQKQGTAINCLCFLHSTSNIWYLDGSQGTEQRCIFYSQNTAQSLGGYFSSSVINLKPDCHTWSFLEKMAAPCHLLHTQHSSGGEVFPYKFRCFLLQIEILVKHTVTVVWNETVCKIPSKTNETHPYRGWWQIHIFNGTRISPLVCQWARTFN